MHLYGKAAIAETVIAAYQTEVEAENYRIYTSDILRYAAQAIGTFCGQSPELPRYYDILHPQPEERRSTEDIVQSIREKLGKRELSEGPVE